MSDASKTTSASLFHDQIEMPRVKLSFENISYEIKIKCSTTESEIT
jgi:hypothetical protein